MTISLLTASIGKLRAVEAKDTARANAKLDLWRGMRDLSVPDEFMANGGTELAPMSTSTDVQMALQYAASSRGLIFKVRTDNFMGRGASIAFLSSFPAEQETIFPPL